MKAALEVQPTISSTETDSDEKCALKVGLAQGILEDDEEIIAKEASFGNPPQEDCLTCMMCDNQTDCISASN